MRRIWIHFTERQAEAIAADARRRDLPMSQIVRDLVAEHYGLEPERVEIGRPYKSPEARATGGTAMPEPSDDA